MKRIIILALTTVFALSLSTTNTFAQKRKTGEKSPGLMTKVKDSIDPASIAGLNNYKADMIFKALKFRRAARINNVAAILDTYSSNMASMKDENLGLIVGLGISVKDIIQEKDFKMLWDARTDYKERVQAVKAEHNAMHTTMENELMEVLTRRQQRKWNKYKDNLRKEAETTFDMGDLFSYVGM